VRYLEEARTLLPNNSRILHSLADVERTRGRWDQSDDYFNQAERLDPRDVLLLTQHALSLNVVRRFDDALQRLEQVLEITPDDVDTSVIKAAIAQAQGDLPKAATLLAPLNPNPNDFGAWIIRTYHATLQRDCKAIIAQLQQILAKPDPAFGFYNGELRLWLGWAQQVNGDHAAAQESWSQTRRRTGADAQRAAAKLGNSSVSSHWPTWGLGNKDEAFALIDRAIAGNPPERDVVNGPFTLEVLARGGQHKPAKPTAR
jgi:tetratricopeptide (TPR) repeat protein